MKKFLFLIMILAATGVCARESHTDGRARIARQVEQYVSLFALDQQDALRFGDIYKSYCKEMHAIRNRYPSSQPSAEMTDDETEQRILRTFAQARAILDTRERYYKEFRTVLTPTQINILYEDEKTRRQQYRR